MFNSKNQFMVEAEVNQKITSRLKPEKSTFRAYRRLVQFSLITVLDIFGVLFFGIFNHFSKEHAARFTNRWCRHLCRNLGIDVNVEGEIPPEGVLLVSNHRSYIDIGVVGMHLPTTFLAKAELQTWPLLGIAARSARVLFVERQNPESRKKSRASMADTLKLGVSVIVFPEGTSFEGPGILPFKQGTFKVAAEEDFPVVPVSIEYENPKDAWVGNDTFIRHFKETFARKRITCTVSFGPVIRNSDHDKLRNTAWNWIHDNLKGKHSINVSYTGGHT